ncbi:MAG TPA: molybdopterin cofactor-binding domain-containing protein [Saprospiraceae bacterium]|nr:molybdopterin cofactor-binding domain-containing protein [Saprospiraceae bacterium]
MSKDKKKKSFSRRKFLVRSAVGVGVLFGAGYLSKPLWQRALAGLANTLEPPYSGTGITPPLWFEVRADNQIILYSPKVEMGQGTFTGLAQIAADELEVTTDQIKVVHAPSDSGNVDALSTGGSLSIATLWTPLRELAATMREMLKLEGAKLLATTPDKVEVANASISSNGKSLTYGEIAAQVSGWEIPDTPELKPPTERKEVGKGVPRVDLREKVLGAPIFGMDATMPDMLYGAVVRPDRIGATFKGADVSKAENMPGVVKIVQEPDFVGVIAQSRMEAENAKNAIQAEWETDRNWTSAEIKEMIKVGEGSPTTIQKKGRASRILNNEEDVISAEFESPIGAHAQLEPNGSVASVEGNQATLMISTQVVKITREEVAKRLGFKPEQVNIIPTYLGGGFGRRLHTPNAVQAAVLSKAVGKPVKCFFNRKEEFQNDTFRPPTHHIMKAKLTEAGKIKAIEHNLSSGDVMFGSPMFPAVAQSLLGADVGAWRGGMIQYGAIPNYKAVSWRVKLPFATSWWRSLGLLANTFAIETFIDELALKAGKDPVQFRLEHIQDDERGFRLKEVIKAASEKAGYKDEVVNGRAMGFACSTDANTPCAQVVEVSMENDRIKVHKVTCVIDPGMAVNPDQVRAQCEGAIIMGLSAAMYEKMEVVDGKLAPTIYGPYQMALMRDTPKDIDVVILENAEDPGPVGEPPLGPIGAAIANAAFRLTGERLRKMPFEG